MADEKTLSASEAAAYLGVHVKTIRAWADRGWVRSIRWPNGWRRFRRSDLDDMRRRMEAGDAGEQDPKKAA